MGLNLGRWGEDGRIVRSLDVNARLADRERFPDASIAPIPLLVLSKLRMQRAKPGFKGRMLPDWRQQRIARVPGRARKAMIGGLPQPLEGLVGAAELSISAAQPRRDVMVHVTSRRDLPHDVRGA